MNRVVAPNTASIVAFDYWRHTVLEEIEKQGISKKRLATIANVERKTIYEWLSGTRTPRLDSVAQIYAALGFDEIRLPIVIREEDECT